MKPPMPSLAELIITYVEAESIVEISLGTTREQRSGSVGDALEVAFTDEPDTPPSRIAFRLDSARSVPSHIEFLVGPRLLAAIDQVVAGPRRTAWIDLSEPELAELAGSWAPYRNVIERPTWSTPVWQQPAGRVTGRFRALWTLLSGAQPVYRNHLDIDAGVAHGEWILPDELAAAAGFDPRITWSFRRRPAGPGVLEVHAACSAESRAPTIVEINTHATDARWSPFTPDESGDLVAVTDLSAEHNHPGVISLRVRQIDSAAESAPSEDRATG